MVEVIAHFIILIGIFFLSLLNGFDCQKKAYYVATSAGYQSSLNGKPILQKSLLSNLTIALKN